MNHKKKLYALAQMHISGSVIFAHLLLVGALVYLKPVQPKLQPQRPVAVQTYVLKEEKPKTVATQPKPAVQPKPVSKPAPKPQPKPKPQASQQPKSDPNRDKLVQMMQQSLASLDSSPASSTKAAPTKQIGKLASEALSFDAGYEEQLIAYLERVLTLPEAGDVKIALTLNRSGGVKSVTVKETASARNRAYVTSMLPALLLPPFDTHFKGENAHTFSITLTSS